MGVLLFYRNSEIRQNPHFVSAFALRVLACAKISNLFIVHFVHGTNLSNSLREFFISSMFRYKKKTTLVGGFSFYRNSEIRTHDLLLPKQALYQAELYSDLS